MKMTMKAPWTGWTSGEQTGLSKDNSASTISPTTNSATPNPPSTNANLRTDWASLFENAFSPNQRHLQQQPPAPDDAPNEACGDTMDPGFPGLHVCTNNVNTLSLSNDLADLHELCTHFQTHNIGIAALQEINLDLTQMRIYTKIKAVFDDTLFGPRPAITSAWTRYVNSNAANVKLFIGYVYKHLQDTGTLKRLRTFQEELPTLTDEATTIMADSIDAQITRALLFAELKCKKPIKAPWSDISLCESSS
jgi:hypothetical protein